MATRSHDPVDPDQPGTAADPALPPAENPAVEASTPVPLDGASDNGRAGRDIPEEPFPDTAGGLIGSAWIGLVLGALVTVLLLIFIAQNTTSTDVRYLGLEFSLPLGVLILLAAIVGALIMAIFAGVRILQLRMRARKARKLTARSH
ncbi:lipopolysaccharide assembly protein LapA domain-containing protein [Dietzia sp. CH92]|uniref:LapA family protein n=1 Tax=Dietzia sp. CH92 TaxID=3051823 RepID=UPI0028D5069C|nr:lipopolysaccharide assembly protein LapA domain-containing protein [Dietzia sp. CH92]